MGLESLCRSGLCGICCFTKGDPDCYLLASRNNGRAIKVIDNMDLTDFVKMHSSELVEFDDSFYVLLNKRIVLLTGVGEYYPCSFLKVSHDDSSITSMLCSIHPSRTGVDYRHYTCQREIFPLSFKTPCHSLFAKDIQGVLIDDKIYSLNPEIKLVFLHYKK